MPEASDAFVLLPIAEVCVVVDAASVEDVEDAARAAGPRRDLAALLGVRWEASPDAQVGRRALRLASDGSWLVAGEQVIVRRLSPDAFRPIPPWLEALRDRLAIASLVVLERGFGFRLDVERLPALDRSEGAAGAGRYV